MLAEEFGENQEYSLGLIKAMFDSDRIVKNFSPVLILFPEARGPSFPSCLTE